MPTIAANTYRLPITEKLMRGNLIIDNSTDNPDVPGNEACVAQLVAAQAALDAASLAYSILQCRASALLAARNRAVTEWDAAVNSLASLTESITGGDPEAILGSGFDIRSPKTPTRPMERVIRVKVACSNLPGYTDLTWKSQRSASVYHIQCCSENDPERGPWSDSGFSTEARFTANGATPGKVCWYRIAAINSLGQGMWSDPARRPVM